LAVSTENGAACRCTNGGRNRANVIGIKAIDIRIRANVIGIKAIDIMLRVNIIIEPGGHQHGRQGITDRRATAGGAHGFDARQWDDRRDADCAGSSKHRFRQRRDPRKEPAQRSSRGGSKTGAANGRMRCGQTQSESIKK